MYFGILYMYLVEYSTFSAVSSKACCFTVHVAIFCQAILHASLRLTSDHQFDLSWSRSATFVWSHNYVITRAVTKGRGPGIFPGYYKSEPRLLWYKTKILEREKCIKLQNYELKNKPIYSLLIQNLIHLLKRGDFSIPERLTENT